MRQRCPFCRVPAPNKVEMKERYEKRMEMDDAHAIFNLGCCYKGGKHGFPRDSAKAWGLFHRAGELGSTKAYYNIGNAYDRGEGVERDAAKAKHYWVGDMYGQGTT